MLVLDPECGAVWSSSVEKAAVSREDCVAGASSVSESLKSESVSSSACRRVSFAELMAFEASSCADNGTNATSVMTKIGLSKIWATCFRFVTAIANDEEAIESKPVGESQCNIQLGLVDSG